MHLRPQVFVLPSTGSTTDDNLRVSRLLPCQSLEETATRNQDKLHCIMTYETLERREAIAENKRPHLQICPALHSPHHLGSRAAVPEPHAVISLLGHVLTFTGLVYPLHDAAPAARVPERVEDDERPQ